MALERVAQPLHVVTTTVTLLFVFASFLLHYSSNTHLKPSVLRKTALRGIIFQCISASYISEVIIISRQHHGLDLTPDHIFAAVITALAWATTCLRKDILVAEATGLSVIALLFGIPGLVLDAIHLDRPAVHRTLIVLDSVRLLFVSGVLANCLFHALLQRAHLKSEEEEDMIPCLGEANGHSAHSPISYGTTRTDGIESSCSEDASDSETSSDEDESDDSRTSQFRKTGSWIAYIQNFQVFIPFLIPGKDRKVQACLLVCVLCLIADRVLNVLVPRQLGIVADKLFTRESPSTELGIYIALNLLHGQSGVEMILSLAKIPIKQFSYRHLTTTAFGHVMDLGMDFHSDRDSAEVMKAMEQGEALTNLVEVALLEIAPAILDTGVAFVFLYRKFTSTAALSMLIATLAFTTVEVITADWNVANRRRQTRAERAEARVLHQAIQGWPTVFIFNMFDHERARFGAAVDRHLQATRAWSQRDAYTTALTEAFFPATFALLATLVAREVQAGRASPGDFVFLVQYWDSLIWPIKYLSKDYRWLVAELVGAERLLDLLRTNPTVTDAPDALALDPSTVEGRIEFNNVTFSYVPDKHHLPTLQNITLTASPGQTIALVGATGAGKSSLTKLLLRAYDLPHTPTAGTITLDAHDIRSLTQSSLRQTIGVVPQNPLLFNISILDNLRYARPSASAAEIHAACRSAAIHEKILSFPKGYATKVGEQGVKLSGGEVQQLAIARVLLKDPAVLVLDEATSAVDTETEWVVQRALFGSHTAGDSGSEYGGEGMGMRRRKRTTFVIAHRLSTVVRADLIVVLHEGRIVERGTHEGLLKERGRYFGLWERQLMGEEKEMPLLDIDGSSLP
ncbi:ABC transporter ATP-binding protein [Aspergillus aculeatinus CBS 121060]|uniref:Abc transporter n=1 Tax=Aspergillus aculeatinus CBS 121060 TaxID=1448322 RepID=A0ACD1HD03_9EURO|nr:abc transporter [Aspergillus aculeatinus CBS 121060]RAH71521.1 abc transporter [Aspergillus aculeatinus CBS 121060]